MDNSDAVVEELGHHEDTADTIKEKLKKNKKKLEEILQLEYGLLDELVSKDVCDLEQVKAIKNTKSSIKQRKKIVDELVEKLTSNPVQRKKILKLLRIDNQHHVAEFIEQEGRLSDVSASIQDCDETPTAIPTFSGSGNKMGFVTTLCDDKEKEDVLSASKNWKVELEQLLDLNWSLLNDLLNEGLIEYKDQIEDLEAKSPSLVQRILILLTKPSPPDRPFDWPIPQFLDALRTTGQEHVANFIERNGCRYASDDKLYKRWPLDLQYESRITRNFRELTELIETDVVFVNSLKSAKCINSLQKCDVDDTPNGHGKARKLLSFLLQSSIANYEDFVECLKKTNQRHVAEILENDVVVEVFDSTTSSSNVIQEQEIVDRWDEVRIIDDIDAVLLDRVGPGVEIVDIQPG